MATMTDERVTAEPGDGGRVALGVRVKPALKRQVQERARQETGRLGVTVSARWVVERALQAYLGPAVPTCGDECLQCERGEAETP